MKIVYEFSVYTLVLAPLSISLTGYRDEEQKDTTRNGNVKGRITGSNSVDSIVDLGKEEEDNEIEFEPRKMVVLHDFIPCVEDEVAVKRGQHVKALYQETDWIYVIINDGKEGFIPFTYCVPEEEYEKRKEKQKGLQRNNFRNASFLDSLHVQTDNTPSYNFKKDDFGDYIVRFEFIACDENDIYAKKGDRVRVLNKDDKDWYWVSKKDGVEGFIPKDFLVPLDGFENGGGCLTFVFIIVSVIFEYLCTIVRVDHCVNLCRLKSVRSYLLEGALAVGDIIPNLLDWIPTFPITSLMCIMITKSHFVKFF